MTLGPAPVRRCLEKNWAVYPRSPDNDGPKGYWCSVNGRLISIKMWSLKKGGKFSWREIQKWPALKKIFANQVWYPYLKCLSFGKSVCNSRICNWKLKPCTPKELSREKVDHSTEEIWLHLEGQWLSIMIFWVFYIYELKLAFSRIIKMLPFSFKIWWTWILLKNTNIGRNEENKT